MMPGINILAMLRKCCFLIFIVLVALNIFPAAIAQTGEPVTHIAWELPQRMPYGENNYLDLIWFPGATYIDSFPAVPLDTHRVENRVPHFSTGFQLLDPIFVPAGTEEEAILLASGFSHEELTFYQGNQWERTRNYSVVSFFPFRMNRETGRHEKLVSFRLQENIQYDESINYEKAQRWAENSVLGNGSWYKVCVENTGIYRLTSADLSELGIPLQGLLKSQIQLFGNGGGMLPEANNAFRYDDLLENAIFVSGQQDGIFGQNDFLLFYGQSPNQWMYDEKTSYFSHGVHSYATENCYFITYGQATGKRIGSQGTTELPATHQVTNYLDYAYHQPELTNLIGSGRIWYGEVFETTLTRDFNFQFTDIDPGTPARVQAGVAARSPVNSSVTIRAGTSEQNSSIPPVNLNDNHNSYARDAVSSLMFTPSQTGPVRVTLTYNRPVNTARGWLHYVAVNVYRKLRFSGSQLPFRNPGAARQGNIAHYTLSNAPSSVTIWDVTDRFSVKRQEVIQNGNNQEFRVENSQIMEFIAFSQTDFPKPRLAGKIGNQNLHGLSVVDMVIVSPEIFLDEAKRLADYRLQHDGITSVIVTPQQIYNEFSSGSPDVSAIRNFMKMFYDRAGTPEQVPRYLLLFGNGTIDNKDKLKFGGNLIPTYQSAESLSPSFSFMTDDYFGLLADHEGERAAGLLDIGIGRLPVRNEEEARNLVDKIIRYDQRLESFHPLQNQSGGLTRIPNYADWRNMVVFIADDGDYNTHLIHAERLSEIVRQSNPEFNIEKIYLDAYPMVTLAGGSRYPDVNSAINNRVNKGALLMNYIGHGGVKGLAQERVVTFDDIATWNNYYNMPVFMTATCEFSSFDYINQDDPDERSAGVQILLKPDGGAVALFTTTRLAWSGTNLVLNEKFTKNVLQRNADGDFHRLGDLIRISKVEADANIQSWRIKNFVLLGDPSMRMAYPRYKIITETMPDTIRAYQKVTVNGYVADEAGNPVPGYDGVIYPTVYDKYTMFETLANATGSNKAGFTMHNSVIYSGKATVANGQFSFSFMVPRDIAYNFDAGKISYYADNGHTDAHGYHRGFIVGGTKQDFSADNHGPELRLFMNDTTFVSGGTTNENPVLLAFISDESGINVTGRIGHDIVAFLNDRFAQPIILNSYYQADMDNYISGRVVYPFGRLAEGRHTLTFRAWDIHNNPSTADLEFYVVSSSQMVLDNLVNFPNPVGHHGTNFRFTHNLPDTDLDVRIEIFDLGGRLLKALATTVQSDGYTSPPVFWDGASDGGHLIGNGVYIYRLLLTTPDGKISQQTEKLLIVRD